MTAFSWSKLRNVHPGPHEVDWEMQDSKVNGSTLTK